MLTLMPIRFPFATPTGTGPFCVGPSALAPKRRKRTALVHFAALVGLNAVGASALHGQLVSARARVDVANIPSFYNSALPSALGCERSGTNSQMVSVTAGCVPGGTGVTGLASASFDDGVLRSSARLSANNATFAATGLTGGEFMSVARVDYSDRITLSSPVGVNPTRYQFSIGWSGQLTEPLTTGNGLSTFSLGALYFIGSGGPFSPYGWVGITRTFSGLPLNNLAVQEFEGRFQGAASRYVNGAALTTMIDGVSTFDGFLTSNTLDFTFAHTSEVEWRNLTGGPVVGVTQDLFSDFSNSARITGLKVFDGNRDVTDLVGVTFASGFELPVTTVPEPSSAVLFAAGATLLACAKGWRRMSRRPS